MTVYSYAQLEQLWINAGGAKSLAPLMAAIAEAESSGNSAATNPNDNNGTQTSWGLWQISNGTHSQPVANILDPAVNARQAVAKYNSQGLSAWGTYDSGAYKAFLSSSTSPDPNVPSGGSATTTAATSSTASACVISLPSVDLYVTSVGGGCLLSKSNVRALLGGLLIGAGGILALAGIAVLVAAGFASTGAGKAVTGAVTAVPGTGRIARTAARAAA